MSLSNLLQITLELWGCMISLILGIFTSSYIREKDMASRHLWALLLINTLTLAGDALAYVYRGDATNLGRIMTHVANFMVFATEYLFSGLFTVYTETTLRNILPEKQMAARRNGVITRICLAMAGLDLLLLIFSQFTGFYYYFDEFNNYHRGPGFMVGMILMGAVMLINIGRLILAGRWMDRGTRDTFLFSLMIPVAAYIIQAIYYGFSLINIAITLALLVLYFRHMLVMARNEYNDELNEAKNETKIAYKKYREALLELETLKKERGDDA